MRYHLIKSTIFFQDLLSSCFQRMTQQIIETLVLLCVSHLFGLYNPNQVADALRTESWSLSLSLYHSKIYVHGHLKTRVPPRNRGGA